MVRVFEVGVRRLPDGLTLDLSGLLGQEGGDAIVRAVEEQPTSPRRLVLNFTAARHINTAGLGGVLWVVRQVTRAGGQVSAYGVSEHLQNIFFVMGLTQHLRVCASEAEALQ